MSSNTHQSPIERSNAFMVKVEDLVREIVIQNNIPFYRIESRMEHHAHAAEGNTYLPVVRIITYFEDSVAPISDVLRGEFDVEMEAPKEKNNIKVDSFASKHIEYKVALKANRLALTEYKRYGTKQFEIQVCSMIQDAWNGIEKELGYNGGTIPDEARRDFYRVGALLEMADIEFLKIRSLLNKQPEGKFEQQAPWAEETRPQAPQVPVFTPQPARAQAAITDPQPQFAAPTEPAEEAYKPIANIFASEPVAYETEPVPQPAPAAEVSERVQDAPAVHYAAVQPEATKWPEKVADATYGVNGLAPQKVPIDNNNVKAENTNVTGWVNNVSDYIANVNNASAQQDVSSSKPAFADTISEAEKNEAPKAAEPANNIIQSVSEAVSAVYTNGWHITPAAEKEPAKTPPPIEATPVAVNNTPTANVPEQVKPVAEKTDGLNVNAKGEMGNTQEPVPAAKEQPAAYIFNDEKPKNAPAPLDENAQMTDVSLREYVLNSKLLREIDTQISMRAGAKLNDEIDIEGDVERLRFLKVFSLRQLHEKLADNKNEIILYAEKWIGKDNGGSFDMGICLFYLEYLLVGKKNDPGFAVEYVLKFISDNDYSARYIIPTYNSIKQSDSGAAKFSHLTLK